MNPEQWLSLKWNGGSTMSDRWLNQSKIIQFLIVTYPACSSVQYYFAPSFQLYRLVRTFVVILLYTYVQIFQAILCNAPMFFSYLHCFFLLF